MKKMKIEVARLSDIFPYYNNPRDNANAVEPVIESFKKFGFIKPIMVDKTMTIICGHTRYIAAYQCGCEYVPIVVSDMPDELVKKYRILDNLIAEKSSFDENELIEELRKMKAPKEMQAFFFEDIDEMLNFSYDKFQQQAYDAGGFSETQDDFYPQEEFHDERPEAPAPREEYKDPADKLFVVQTTEEGKKFMKVVCPYCGNIEEIEYDKP